jgi:hypothetical protein
MLWDIVTFRKMISPDLLQLLFWGGIGGTFYGTYVLIKLEHWAWWIALIFGCLVTRVIFERLILAFRTYDRISEIAGYLDPNRVLDGKQREAIEGQE